MYGVCLLPVVSAFTVVTQDLKYCKVLVVSPSFGSPSSIQLALTGAGIWGNACGEFRVVLSKSVLACVSIGSAVPSRCNTV